MADAALEPGRILAGKYRLGERLGEGGMGAVYRAEHLVLQAPVAIKVIEREIADEGTKARFMREAQAAAALRSPHVVQILDYGTEGDVPFMVMELLEGETLARRIKRKKRLSPQETSWIVTHVGRAVAKAHELGVVHRDLKPDNVFLVQNEEDEIAKVLDFGVAKIEATNLNGDSHTRTGSLLGTPYYMSPEQAQGNKAVDHRSDLWALGVIAFECLTGKRPFASEGLGDLVLQICIRDLPVPSAVAPVPIGFDAWFAKAVQREPDERFQSAKELTDALREALGTGESASAPDILVTSANPSTPSPPGASLEEDARPTAVEGGAVEGGAVDASAETIAEELLPNTLAALRNATTQSASGDPHAPQPEAGQPPLSVSLHDVSPAQAQPSAGQPAPARRRSHVGLFFAVGFTALATGMLVAVLALSGRPGFRVGDIEAPADSRTRSTQGAAKSSTKEPADDEASSTATPPRKSAATRATRSSEKDASSSEEDDSPPIDGRSILDTDSDPTSTDPEGKDTGAAEASSENQATETDGKKGDTEATEQPDAKDTKGADPKSATEKPADPKPAEPKPTDPKSTDPKPTDPKPADPKPADPKSTEPKSGGEKPADPKPTPPSGKTAPDDTKPAAPPNPTEPQAADPGSSGPDAPPREPPSPEPLP